MKYAVARMHGKRQRLFTGKYNDRCATMWPLTPRTTGQPSRAKHYDDQAVAEAVARVFNVLDAAYTGLPGAWVAMPLPERVSP